MVAVLVAVFAFVVIYFPARSQKAGLDALERQATHTAQMLALGVGIGLGLNEYSAVQSAFAWATRDPTLTYIAVADSAGVVFAQHNPRGLPVVLLERGAPPAIGAEILQVVEPVRFGGVELGILQIGVTLSQLKVQARADTQRTLLVALLVLVLASGVAYTLAHVVTRPVLALKEAAIRVAGGDYEVSVGRYGSDEVGALADGFRSMVAAVRSSMGALERQAAELSEARDRALDAAAAKSAFLATMSHEIRTPLNGVLGMTSLLKETDLAPQQRHYVDRAIRSGEALLQILSDVLDISKLDADRVALESVPVDLRALAEEVAEIFAVEAGEKGIELVLRYDAATPRHFLADPGRLRQILINLVGNAVKFTHEGQVAIGVHGYGDTGERARIRIGVRDTGVGIPEDRQRAIFETFSQADSSTTRRFGGAGLGLAIARRLVGLMGGRLGVESRTGKGSTFWVDLELALDRDRVGSSESGPTALAGTRIMILTPQELTRDAVSDQLRAWGARVCMASDPETGVAELLAGQRGRDPYRAAIVHGAWITSDGPGPARPLSDHPELSLLPLVGLVSVGSKIEPRRPGSVRTVELPFTASQLCDALVEALRGGVGKKPDPEAAVAAANSGNGVARSAHGTVVLLVEDNEVNQEDGQKATEMVDPTRHRLVLMDCEMPVMDGLRATEEIRGRESPGTRIPIIAMTAHALRGDRERCLAVGMDDHLTKPITLDKLRATLDVWLGQADVDS